METCTRVHSTTFFNDLSLMPWSYVLGESGLQSNGERWLVNVSWSPLWLVNWRRNHIVRGSLTRNSIFTIENKLNQEFKEFDDGYLPQNYYKSTTDETNNIHNDSQILWTLFKGRDFVSGWKFARVDETLSRFPGDEIGAFPWTLEFPVLYLVDTNHYGCVCMFNRTYLPLLWYQIWRATLFQKRLDERCSMCCCLRGNQSFHFCILMLIIFPINCKSSLKA